MSEPENKGIIPIKLTGRIDSTNVEKIEADVFREILDQEGEKIRIDVSELTYISSAGLRVLMKLRKATGKAIEIDNVSREVYEIFEITGFTELFTVKKALRSIRVEGLEEIGRGFFGTVYRIDRDSIVKVYNGADKLPMIENEIKIARKAFLSGIPTAIAYDIVKVGNDYGSVFEMLNARTFHELVQKEETPLEDILSKYVSLLKSIHHTKMEEDAFPLYKESYLGYLEVIREHLTNDQYQRLRDLIVSMKDEHTVVHGDVQMKNVMLVGEEPMLIDMDTLGLGNPVFDLAGLYVTYQLFEEDDPDNAMDFLGMTNEMVDNLWKGILDYYFDQESEEDLERIADRIALTASIRFLYLMESTDLKKGELGKMRIAHTKEHIEDLLKRVTTLAV